MIPMRTSSVFRSRWMALLWAGGIIWFALDYAGSAKAPDNTTANSQASASDEGSAANSDEVKKAADALGL
jgi:hypothetical protein